MLSTPSTAPVGSPVELVSGGRAWNARYRYDEPSTSTRAGRSATAGSWWGIPEASGAGGTGVVASGGTSGGSAGGVAGSADGPGALSPSGAVPGAGRITTSCDFSGR